MEKRGDSTWVEEGVPCCQEERNLIQFVLGQTPPLGKTLKRRHPNQGHDEDHDTLWPTIDVV